MSPGVVTTAPVLPACFGAVRWRWPPWPSWRQARVFKQIAVRWATPTGQSHRDDDADSELKEAPASLEPRSADTDVCSDTSEDEKWTLER